MKLQIEALSKIGGLVITYLTKKKTGEVSTKKVTAIVSTVSASALLAILIAYSYFTNTPLNIELIQTLIGGVIGEI